jgi:hypothetical protein
MSKQKRSYPPLNEKHIAKVLKYMEDYPERYVQNLWLEYCGATKSADTESGYTVADSRKGVCDTKGCFAGNSYLLGHIDMKPKDVVKKLVEKDVELIDYEADCAERCGLTLAESGYLTQGTETDDPAENLRIIKARLAIIRKRRAKHSVKLGEPITTVEGIPDEIVV